MNKKIVIALAELEAIACIRSGMIAENECRARLDKSQAYGDQHFFELADRALKAKESLEGDA